MICFLRVSVRRPAVGRAAARRAAPRHGAGAHCRAGAGLRRQVSAALHRAMLRRALRFTSMRSLTNKYYFIKVLKNMIKSRDASHSITLLIKDISKTKTR